MITAERLEELIKQGGTVYYMSTAGMLKEIKVEPLKNTLNCNWVRCNLDRFYESKESLLHSQWHRKIDAERTERFEPPMWEDIGKDKNYKFKFMDNEDIIEFIVSKAPTMFYSNGYVFVCNSGTREVYISEPATKENYIKACEIVRELFNKGGAK